MSIRPERPADVREIHALHAASFPTEDEAALVSALRAVPGAVPPGGELVRYCAEFAALG